MISRRSLFGTVSGLACLTLFGSAGKAWAQDVTMKLTATAANDLDTEWLRLLKNGVEARSKGSIRAEIYPASQLGSAETLIEGVTMGTVEVTMNASGTYEGLDPRFAALAVPGLIVSMEQGAKLLADADLRQRLRTIARDKGIEVITALVISPAAIASKRPIAQLADLRGMQIRVPGSAVIIEQLKRLGASPVSMSLGEALPAFQNGTIDGVFAGTTIFSALKFADISKNMTVLPGSFVVVVALASTVFLEALGPRAAMVRDAAHAADMGGIPWGEADVANARMAWEQQGGRVMTLTASDAEAYLATVVPAGLEHLTPEARADYDFFKSVAAKYV